MIWLQLGLALLGLIGLFYGAEWLVGGSSRLAFHLGISPLIVGLTIVAFGTSSPELLVALRANPQGNGSLVMGNVTGSNIYNLALILGIGAFIYPLKVPRQLLVRDMPIMLLASFALLWLVRDDQIARWEGGALFAGLLGYLVWSGFTSAKQIKESVAGEFAGPSDQSTTSVPKCLLVIVGGITCLGVGAELLVDSAEKIARHFGISDAVIGLTLLAFGTSVPELATVVVASMKREGDIITGNIIGSNIFNIMAILGITALGKPIQFQAAPMTLDFRFMLGIALLCYPLMITRRLLSRWEGAVLLIVCTTYLFFVYQRI